jgi:hypothetical protein
MKGGAHYHLAACGGLGFMREKEAANCFCRLSRQHTHQRLNGQQWRCVMAQVGPGIHDGVDLFDG